MKIHRLLSVSIGSLLVIANSGAVEHPQQLTDHVNPFSGTATTGHTFPGATVPFGMVQLSPDTGTYGWKYCSGYHSDDKSLLGFSHTHLSGTGCGDLMNILFIPQAKDIDWEKLKWETGKRPHGSAYRTAFDRTTEQASPGYYTVKLENGIGVELTATARCGVHRYSFPQGQPQVVLIDLFHTFGLPNRTVMGAGIYQESPTTLVGWQTTSGWARNKTFYFVASFSRPVKTDVRQDHAVDAVGPIVRAAVYPEPSDAPLEIKVGLSSTGIEGARNNLTAEVGNRGFDTVRSDAQKVWEKTLSPISVQTNDQELLRVFYTALYRTMVAPNVYNDVDGTYMGADFKIHPSPGFDYYSTLSLWDTFRATHPLYTIIRPDIVTPIILGMLDHSDKFFAKNLPKWTLCSNETNCMIGYHSVPVILDAYRKGFRSFDANKALKAMERSAEVANRKTDYATRGYRTSGKDDKRPHEKRPQGTSITLEQSYDDFCIAEFAKMLGNKEIETEFRRRADFYKNVWQPENKFFWGKDKEGNWIEPFNPYEASHDIFTEGTAWQWLWSVMHDVPSLIDLLGGNEAFCKKLDALFADNTPIKSDSPDVSGLIGQYAHGNEPCHHAAYLYCYAKEPWKTQYWVNHICRTMYKDARDGLCGNDDCGQMSAWFVFSSLGLYPVNPASSIYVIGSPMFERAEIQTPQTGKTFTIIAKNVSKKNIYIQSAKLNGKVFDRSWLSHDELTSGATLEFVMGSEPNKSWGNSSPIPGML